MHMVMSRDQHATNNYSIQTAKSSFESVGHFRYLETTLTDQNSILEEIKSKLTSGNACSHSVQNIVSSSLLFKNVKIRIHKTII